MGVFLMVQGDDDDQLAKLEEENNKLRALVNVGQDSNRQQEQLISQLQKELSASKVRIVFE